jgi:hypothetical protein
MFKCVSDETKHGGFGLNRISGAPTKQEGQGTRMSGIDFEMASRIPEGWRWGGTAHERKWKCICI